MNCLDKEEKLSERIQLKGEVIKGFQRGRKIGFRTANICPGIRMEEGVYYGQVMMDNKVYHSVISVGKNPTFELKQSIVEVHILHDFTNEFYGNVIKVIVFSKLRGLFKVDSIEDLKKMINGDIEYAEKIIVPSCSLLDCSKFDF